MHNIKSITKKDRYGNMFSLEMFEDKNVPMMIMVPDMPDGFNGANTDNHPGNPKGTDTVPAWLTPGENVVNAEASRIPGNQEKIDQMNKQGRQMQAAQGGPIPSYAAGGMEVPRPDGMLNSLSNRLGDRNGGPMYSATGDFITDDLLNRLRRVESDGNANATSEAGAMGQYQIMPSTAADPGMGVTPLAAEDIRNPVKSREFAREYLMAIAAYNPDFTEDEVITAYHSGTGNVRKAKAGTEALGPRGRAYAGKVNNASGVGPDAFGVNRRKVATGDPNAVPPVPSEESNLFNVDQMKRAAMYPLEMFGLPVDADAPGKPVPNIFDLLPDDPGMTNVNAAIVKNDTENEKRLADLINKKKVNNETVTPELVQMHKDAVKKLEGSKKAQQKELDDRAKVETLEKKRAEKAQSYDPKLGEAQDKKVSSIITKTTTANKADQPPVTQAGDSNAVAEAGLGLKGQDPGFFQQSVSVIKDVLGEMFSSKDIARIAIQYVGSRALGYAHNGSLNYAMKEFAEDKKLKQKQEFELVKANAKNYTVASYNKYLLSKDINDLEPVEVSRGITGQAGTRFDRATGLEVPVYTIGTGDDKRLVTQGAGGVLLDLSKPKNRVRFEVMNDSVHNPTKVTKYFQTSLDNRSKEINRTIEKDDAKIDFATDELAGESYILYEKTRNTFGMDSKQSQRLKNEIVAAQGDYLKAYKAHKKDSDNRKPTSLEGYYNKRVIKLKTKGIISYNDVKNTLPENMAQLEQTLANIAADAANGDPKLEVKTYRDLWASGKETWNNMKSRGRFTEGKTEGYDPFIAWMQAVLVGDETALKLEDPSNMKR